MARGEILLKADKMILLYESVKFLREKKNTAEKRKIKMTHFLRNFHPSYKGQLPSEATQ